VAYRERQAEAVALRPWVQCVWSVRTDGNGSVLPDGCMDVLWTGSRLLVAGPDTSANRSGVPVAGIDVVGVRFRPGAGGAAVGLPASELRDARVDLEEVWGAPARELAERMAQSGGDPRLLEDAVAARVMPLDPLMLDAAARVARGERVAAVARDVALSERQLRRRFHDAVGYGPKTLGRVMRLQRFLRLGRAQPDVGLAALAAEAGYADQAHLSDDARALTGRTPSALLRR
jgi:AraC-like DNA-binding protein